MKINLVKVIIEVLFQLFLVGVFTYVQAMVGDSKIGKGMCYSILLIIGLK